MEVRFFHAGRDEASWRLAKALRLDVFVREQGIAEREEFDSHDLQDPTCVHALIESGRRGLGTGRLYEPKPDEGKVGRIAVALEHRGHGAGSAILRALIKEAQGRGLTSVALDAQVHAVGFYMLRGFAPEGPDFMDCGIPHRRMRLSFSAP
jgi:predicted GNAT family N-acyltransferase